MVTSTTTRTDEQIQRLGIARCESAVNSSMAPLTIQKIPRSSASATMLTRM
jgi:hypothetical protein